MAPAQHAENDASAECKSRYSLFQTYSVKVRRLCTKMELPRSQKMVACKPSHHKGFRVAIYERGVPLSNWVVPNAAHTKLCIILKRIYEKAKKLTDQMQWHPTAGRFAPGLAGSSGPPLRVSKLHFIIASTQI